MGRIFYPTESFGKVPQIRRMPVLAAQTFKAGALVILTGAGPGTISECGLDPASITGVALQDAFSGPGYNAADNPTVVTGRDIDISVAVANRDTIFSGRAVNGATDPVIPLVTHIGETYGVLKTGAGEWVIDITEVTVMSIIIVDIDLNLGTNLFFFKFREAFLQQP